MSNKKYNKLNLIKAVSKGNLKKIKKIIENENIDINTQDVKNRTALHIALTEGYIDIAKLLINLGADVNIKTNRNVTALHLVSKIDNESDKIAKMLIENKAEVNSLDFEGNTPLHEACMSGKSNIVNLLIKNGAEINIKGKYGFTPLHEASNEGYFDIVKLLIENGAYLNKTCDIVNWTPLYYAIRNFHKDIIEILIESGSNLNAAQNNEESPLHMIIDKEKTVKNFLGKFDIMLANLGSTNHIYHIPTEDEKIEIIKLLIKNGANLNSKAYNNKTPLQYALDKGYEKIAKLLRSNGATEE